MKINFFKEKLKTLIKAEDRVVVDHNRKSGTLSVKPVGKPDKEFLEWTDSFIKEYRPALEKLADK